MVSIMYRISTVYQPYIYRVCTVVDSERNKDCKIEVDMKGVVYMAKKQ